MEPLSPVQMDTTLIYFIYIYHGHNIVGQQLTPNIFRCYMLHPLMHSLSHVVGSCCAKFETGPTFGSTTPGQHFFHSMIAEGECNKVGYLCTALPTLLGPCTCQDGCDNLMAASRICSESVVPSSTPCSHV